VNKFLDPEEQKLALQASLRKAFRVHCDFYEPESDEWLSCQFLFKNLFFYRDEVAQEINLGPEELLSNEQLYLMARSGRKTDLLEGATTTNKDFIAKAAEKLTEWMRTFPDKKAKLIEENKSEALLGHTGKAKSN